MAVTDGSEEPDFPAEPPEPQTTVSVHRSSPERLVFTEEGNTDGWIATDLAVDLER
jgi:hypothetical protein